MSSNLRQDPDQTAPDPLANIQFAEAESLPVGKALALAAGLLVVCGMLFFGLYLVFGQRDDGVPANPAPAPLGTPDRGPLPKAAPPPAPEPKPRQLENMGKLPITTDADGGLVVTQPSECAFLTVHIKNMEDLAAQGQNAQTLNWIEQRISNARKRLSDIKC